MNLMSKVIFSYHIRAGRFGESSSFYVVDEVKNSIKNDRYQQPFSLQIKRTVEIVDTDIKPKESDFGTSFFPTLKDPTVVAEIPTDDKTFTIADKLTYPKDVSKYLIQKYGDVLDFDETKFKPDVPVSFKGIEESQRIGLPNPETRMPTTYIFRHVVCTPLNEKAIVLDTNLNQIWPEKTKEMSPELSDILNKTVATDLSSRVVFCTEISDEKKFFASMQDLQELTQKVKQPKPYNEKFTRIVQIVHNSLIRAEIPADNKTFTIADKLIYPKDVSKYLIQKYGDVLDFDETKYKPDVPVSFKVLEDKCKNPNGTVFCTLRRVICTPLTKMSIVLDTNLNQMWPEKTDKMSSILAQILAKNKEEIRQKE